MQLIIVNDITFILVWAIAQERIHMKVNGIIAEYNPFHNGHQYHLDTSRTSTGADYTIIAMSGNFTQRGEPAILDKHSRAKMALMEGADLVLEIPSIFAVGSAEYFALGGVTLLDQLGITNYLCFGSESGNIDMLTKTAKLLLDEPPLYRQHLQEYLRGGHSFPMARNLALKDTYADYYDLTNGVSAPNNILGIEYIKCLLRRKSSIKPHTILRVGSNYHEKRLGLKQSSALALRQALFSRQDVAFLADQMPPGAFSVLEKSVQSARPICPNDFSLPLHFKLLNEAEKGFRTYMDVNAALSDRICNKLYQYTNFTAFCELLKSKDMTYSRISRSLIHILLNILKEDYENSLAMGAVPYARVLGFRSSAAPLLNAIKEHSSIPLVTKLADAEHLLSGAAIDFLKKDIYVSNIYASVATANSKQPMKNEYTTPLVII
jgi:predicted nucleotidyltransferase